ncbi:MAG: pyridoxal 5'-phosphate synthase glutaminase subunit PdxT [Nitrososphaerales archaeon]|nr:pyridoxal 5'-phosphate synthase glutaminase subunit PdxT [Nitrososphaerales archaeon]
MSGLTVGILGLQGDIEEHLSATSLALSRLGVEGEPSLVKSTDDAKRISALIIPGGESTVMGGLSSIKGILPTLRERITNGLPTLGTCAGMITLAKRVYDRVVGETSQTLIGTLDITVERNSFGRQRESFEADLKLDMPGGGGFHAVFIRAPSVKSLGQGVNELARLGDAVVAVQQGNMIATAFHPELSGSTILHEYLIRLAKADTVQA